MSGIANNATLQGSCQSGGLWYTCTAQDPTFLGCCNSNPCNGVGCPTDDLRPASLGAGVGPDACENDSSFWPYVTCPSGSDWYTCLETTPSFQGCCTINPCQHGSCPLEDLMPAEFATSPLTDVPAPSCPNTSPVASPTSTSTQPSTTPTKTPSASSVTDLGAARTSSSQSAPTVTAIVGQHNSGGSNKSIPAIAGGVAGGCLVLALILLAFCWRRRAKRSRALDDPSPNIDSYNVPAPKSEGYYGYGQQSPNTLNGTPGPPAYKSQQSPLNTPPQQYQGYQQPPQEYAAYQSNQIHEISTSHIYHPVEAPGSEGLGIQSVGSDEGQWGQSNRASELSGLTAMNSPALGSPRSGDGRFEHDSRRDTALSGQSAANWQAYSR